MFGVHLASQKGTTMIEGASERGRFCFPLSPRDSIMWVKKGARADRIKGEMEGGKDNVIAENIFKGAFEREGLRARRGAVA